MILSHQVFAHVMLLADSSKSSSSEHIYSFDSTGHATRDIKDGNYKGRSYLIKKPSNYDNSKKHAVVLSFHGNGGTSAKQEKITQLSNPGLTINKLGTSISILNSIRTDSCPGIIVVYPQASLGKGKNGGEKKKSWQGAPYAADDVDDVRVATS